MATKKTAKKKPAAKKRPAAAKQTAKKSAVKPKAKPKAKKKEDNGLVLARNPANPDQQFYVASELADDAIIEQETLGQVATTFVYSFKQNGQEVTGLSVSGVNEVARRLSRKANSGVKIRIVPESIKIERDVEMDGDKGIQVYLIAENMVTGETAVGVKFEPYQKKGARGKYANTFAIEKATSKAERNAKRKLIPEQLAIKLIKNLIGESKSEVRTIAPPQYQPPSNYINAAPATESTAQKFERAKKMLRATTNVDGLIEYSQKVDSSTDYNAAQKRELKQICSERVDILTVNDDEITK